MRAFLIAFLLAASGIPMLARFSPETPFTSASKVRVLIFLRSDCPVANRYAPELERISKEFPVSEVSFWMVYPDKDETTEKIKKHMLEYSLPGSGITDPQGFLQKRAEATISPQAAVFDQQNRLLYSGRIDDRIVSWGKTKAQPDVHDLEDAIRAVLADKPVAESRTRAFGCYLSDLH